MKLALSQEQSAGFVVVPKTLLQLCFPHVDLCGSLTYPSACSKNKCF
jgi:hypothetical protein